MKTLFTYDDTDMTRPLLHANKIMHGKARVGDRAGYLVKQSNTRGISARVKVKGTPIGMHRAVWEYFNGSIPVGMTVDHINGDIYDNRIENLQILSSGDNKRKGSTSNYSNNSSGVTGVLWDSKQNKWKVSFRYNKVLYYFGMYEELDDAIKVCNEKRKSICVLSDR